MTLEDDHAALARSREEPQAFEIVFDRHFTAIHRYVAGRVGALAADELAAEVFVRAFSARDRYVGTTSDARAWLFAIATNLVRDEARRRRREADAGARWAAMAGPETALASIGGTDPALRDALLTLRKEELEVLLLFAWAELSYDEIAQATGSAVGTVRSRLSRARARLQHLLSEPIAEAHPEELQQ